LAVTDVNRDGHLDLLVANFGTAAGGSVSVLSGSAGFSAFPGTPVGLPGLNPVAVASGDLNKDGKPDFVTANAVSNDISVALNSGNVNPFNAANGYAAGTFQSAVAIGDFNRDGNPDLAVARTTGKLSI